MPFTVGDSGHTTEHNDIESKLDGIEVGATADQTAAEIEAAFTSLVPIVSQVTAEAGTSATARQWTPQRVAQAIAALAPSAASPQSINAQTGTTYTLVLADAANPHKLVTLDNGAAITVTLPSDASVAIPVGSFVEFMTLGGGQVTVVAGAGVNPLQVSGLTAKSRAQYSRFGAQKVAANTWSVFGDLAAS